MAQFLPSWFIHGGPVMWPLLLASIIALALAVERAHFWWKDSKSHDPQTIHRILHLTERGLLGEAALSAKRSSDAVVRILDKGLSRHFSLQRALEIGVNVELKRMKRFMGALDTIVTVTPLLGIFGTVLGILHAFGALEGRIPDPQIVSAGIAVAVVTTLFGLGIAIPTIIAYNTFSGKLEDAASRISTEVTNFQILYEKGKQKADLISAEQIASVQLALDKE